LALAEMYVQGVSTRKVIEVLQKLVGPDVSISSTQISRCAEKLDVGLEAWRNRPLDETPYVLLDARYERVREAGQVMDCAVLVAVGVTASGHRRVLGVSVALSEAEVHWRKEHPKLAAWAEENLTEGFAVFALPPEHRVRMRTTNGVESLNKEIKRRTRVATLFPNSASCLRLVSAILAEQDEEWMTAKIYLTMNP
jgi:transposase-like protein